MYYDALKYYIVFFKKTEKNGWIVTNLQLYENIFEIKVSILYTL